MGQKKGTVSYLGFTGLPQYLVADRVEEVIWAAENTSAVKVFTKEEIAEYAAQLKK